MTKTEALQLLGGSATSAAIKIGCSVQAVSNWPEKLTKRLQDRVEAVLWREHQDMLKTALDRSYMPLQRERKTRRVGQ